ncbi:MFS transporter [Actinokineospora inagensis]|uniref:MFS transporter n=1 Tax=Actinokineospora inagensis TaxID=103730 RepID=UPI000403F6BB|nr:MFS transporter [Actinokineospora inagensis]
MTIPDQDGRARTGARSGFLPLAAICLGFFIVMVDTTIVNVALPAISHDFGGGVVLQQWVVDSYTLVFAALLLSAGAAADRLGPRRVFEAGLLAFAVFSAACAFAPNGPLLVLARALQGLGAAALVPASLALINTTYHDRAARAKAIGVWGGMGGIAAAVGPVVGGALITLAGWPSVFLVNVPVSLAAYLLVRHAVPRSVPNPTRSVDVTGQVLAVVSLVVLVYGIIEGGGPAGWSPRTLGIVAAGLALVAVFLVVEHRKAQAMLPTTLFRDRVFSAAAATGLLLNFGFYGQFFVLTLYFQQLRHFSPLTAGLLLVPEAVGAIIGSPLGGRAAARIGARYTMVIGLTAGALGFLAFVLVDAGSGYALIVPAAFAAGLGMGFAMPAATTAAIEAAPRDLAGLASGAVNTARQLGSVLGVAVLGALVATGLPFLTGFHLAVAASAVVFLAGAALNLIVRPRRPSSVDADGEPVALVPVSPVPGPK